MDHSLVSLAFQGSGGPPGGMLLQLVPFVLIFVIFYFLLIAPARKRQKALQLLIDNLKRGDRVTTSGGIYGEVVSVDGPAAILKIADNVKVKVAKSAITGLEGGAEKGSES
jgi:preprotein translocase subunit YajC